MEDESVRVLAVRRGVKMSSKRGGSPIRRTALSVEVDLSAIAVHLKFGRKSSSATTAACHKRLIWAGQERGGRSSRPIAQSTSVTKWNSKAPPVTAKIPPASSSCAVASILSPSAPQRLRHSAAYCATCPYMARGDISSGRSHWQLR